MYSINKHIITSLLLHRINGSEFRVCVQGTDIVDAMHVWLIQSIANDQWIGCRALHAIPKIKLCNIS